MGKMSDKYIEDEEERYAQMEEELKWYQKLTNKKKKK